MREPLHEMDAANRFTDRVDNYVRYRPGYPPALLDALRDDCGLADDHAIADIGCGPGNLTRLFLENGDTVFGVEPNAAMRAAGEQALAAFPRFHAVDGRAEATGLSAHSVDWVIAGQAFHWFEPEAARAEFRRILKPGGWVLLVWNERARAASCFDDAYEAMLMSHGVDYQKIRASRGNAESIAAFFEGAPARSRTFLHEQWFDFDGLKGRLLSSSYAPPPGHAGHGPMLDELRAIFETHQQAGRVQFRYETLAWYGHLRA